jgi:hypothetical protein
MPKAKGKAKGKKPQVVLVDTPLAGMTVVELKKICKGLNIPCPVKKSELIVAIGNARAAVGPASIKIPSPRKSSPKKVSPKKYDAMTLTELRKICRERGLDAKKCKLNKPEVIAFLKEADKVAGPKPPSPKRSSKSPKSPKGGNGKKKPAGKIGGVDLCFELDGSKKCGTDICDVETGKCVKITKKKRPYGEKKFQDAYGGEYYYDDKNAVIGKREHVLDFIGKMAGKKPVSPRKSSPKASPKKPTGGKKKKATCYDKTGYNNCDPGTICSTASGKCVADKPLNRKGKWELRVDDRVIVGTEDVIKDLNKILGGTIRKADEKGGAKPPSPKPKPPSPKLSPKKPSPKPSPKKPSPKPSPKTVEDIEKRLQALVAGAGADEETRRLEAQLAALRARAAAGGKKPSPKRSPRRVGGGTVTTIAPVPPPRKVDITTQDVYKSFQSCLASLK